MVTNTPNLATMYMTPGQVVALLHVNRLTVQRWINKGKLRKEKVGNVTLIPKEDVLKIAKERGTNIIW
jgi:excisionase family DNA binding protein